MTETYELRATISTTVEYKLPGQVYPTKVACDTRDLQEVLSVLPCNVVEFSIYDSLKGSVSIDGLEVIVRNEWFNATKTYYVDAELIPDDEVTEFDSVLDEREVRVRLCDGRIEFKWPEHFEIVSFTG